MACTPIEPIDRCRIRACTNAPTSKIDAMLEHRKFRKYVATQQTNHSPCGLRCARQSYNFGEVRGIPRGPLRAGPRCPARRRAGPRRRSIFQPLVFVEQMTIFINQN